MTRTYTQIKPKKHFVYTVCDLTKLYEVDRNTVSNWVKEGLTPSDAATPYVFRGAEVKRFHDARRITNVHPLRKGQFKCMSCRSRIFPDPQSLTRSRTGRGTVHLQGTCPTCDCQVRKIVSEADCDMLMKCADNNTSLARLDEDSGPATAGIGIAGGPTPPVTSSPNDRILHNWLQFAGRWHDCTTVANLAAIREFELFLGEKAFEKIALNDVTAFRENLKSRVGGSSNASLSVSTIRHRASHLKDFFTWLVEQKGFRHLGRALPTYFELPKRFDAVALSSGVRQVPSVDEAVVMIERMPVRTTKDRRDRAMVAIAFLGALRADTITSPQVGHLRRSEKVIIQDARLSRTKNGKSLRVKYFPLPAIFADTVAG